MKSTIAINLKTAGQCFTASLVAVVTMLVSAPAWAACSSEYHGLVTLNEVAIAKGSNKTAYIEVKVLSSSIPSDAYKDWSLEYCVGNGSCSGQLDLAEARTDSLTWLRLEGPSLDGLDLSLQEMDIMVRDGNGGTIDYLSIGGADVLADGNCAPAYDGDLDSAPGNSDRLAVRVPDGTGDWMIDPGNSGYGQSPSATNDGDSDGPEIDVAGDGSFAGDPLTFRVSLSKPSSNDITISFVTRDDSAVAPDDYAEQSGTLTIPANSTSYSISVPTVADNDRSNEHMFLELRSSSGGFIASGIGVGEIWPAATGLWRFERSTADSSGNGLDGSGSWWFGYSNNSPAIADSPGTCYYGVLLNGGGQYGRFTVDDDPGLDLSDALTIAAWVRRDESGSGYVLSKGGNYQWYANDDGRLFWLWAGGSLTTSAEVLPRGVWAHIAVTYRDGEQVVYVNGEVAETGTSSGTLATNGEALMLGREFFWDILGTGSRFDGAVDELHIYSDALPRRAVQELYNRTYPCDGSAVLDRLEITAPSSASVCAATTVGITAYDSNDDVLDNYEGTVSLSTSSGHGRWGRYEGSGILSPEPGDSDDGLAGYQFVTADGGDATFTYANTHADVLTITAVDVDTGISATSEPIIFAENALFIESADTLGDDLIAGRAHDYRASMRRQDPVTGDCGVAEDYEGSIGLKAWLDRAADDPDGSAPVLSSSEDTVQLPDATPSGNNLVANFVGGEADLSLLPSDVGRFTLNLLDDSSGFVKDLNGDPIPIISASAAAPWTARPFAIALDVPGNPAAQDASGARFQAAGENFTLRVGGALYDASDDLGGDGVADAGATLMDNGFASSFGREGEQTHLLAQLLAPVDGTNPGLAGPQLQASDFSGGLAAVADYRFTEVGIINITGTIDDGNYLRAGSARTARMAGASGPVGRFVPDHFAVEASDNGTLEMACGGTGGFTYSGQDMGWAVAPEVQVTPKNLAGAETRNYLIGDFMRLLPEGVSRNWPGADEDEVLTDGVTLYPVSVDTNTGEIVPRNDGDPVLYRYSSDDRIRYTKSVDTLVAPFTPSVMFEIEDVIDQDDVAALITGTGSVPLSLTPTATGDILYGRRTMDNVYGPETADELFMPFYMEYWTGSGFALNQADDCTGWVADSDLQDDEQYHSLESRGEAGTFVAGQAGPLVLKPTGDRGEEMLTWQNLPIWQQHDWDGDDNLQGPSATATFGVYRGHDRIIYWREVTN